VQLCAFDSTCEVYLFYPIICFARPQGAKERT
jgi:hypothetical protein